MTGPIFAFLELPDLPRAFYFLLRLVVAGAAGAAGWFLGGHLASLLHRMAFQKPMPGGGIFVSRLVATVGLALLAYFLIPIGPGSGWGPGGGTGAGSGTNTGNGEKVGTGGSGYSPGGSNGGKTSTPNVAKGDLPIEIVAPDR